MIKRSEKIGEENRGEDLESGIKEDKGKKEGDLETLGQEDFFLSVDKEDLETVGHGSSNPPDPPYPPRRIQIKFDKENL